ncbi:MAG: hypothetical protein AB1847_04670 [bacterium]
MKRKIFFAVFIVSIAMLFVSGSSICSNVQAQGGWGGPFQTGGGAWSSQYWGYGGGSPFMGYPSSPAGRAPSMGYSSYPSMSYTGNFTPVPVNIALPVSTTSAASSTTVEPAFAGSSDAWQAFITQLQEKYPDLEGVDWENSENWTDDDWKQLREALSEERSAQTLQKFIDNLTEKWDSYGLSDWEEFNSNWNAFIIDVQADEDDDTALTWAGFRITYGCFDNSDPESGPDPDDVNCWQSYGTWTNKQWTDFRGLYNRYVDHEWREFCEILQAKWNDYNTIDWADWRGWTDADWEKCLAQLSSSSNRSSAALVNSNLVSSGPGYAFGLDAGIGYAGWGFSSVPGMGYSGWSTPNNMGYTVSPGIGYASFSAPSVNTAPGALNGGFSGWGGPGYGWGVSSEGYTGRSASSAPSVGYAGWGYSNTGGMGYSGWGAPGGFSGGYSGWGVPGGGFFGW